MPISSDFHSSLPCYILCILHAKGLNSKELNPSQKFFSLESDLFFGILQEKINKFHIFFQWSVGMMDVYFVLVMPTLEKVDQWWVQMNHQSQWELYRQPLLGFIELSKRKKQGKVEKSSKLLSAVLFNALQGGSLSNGQRQKSYIESSAHHEISQDFISYFGVKILKN